MVSGGIELRLRSLVLEEAVVVRYYFVADLTSLMLWFIELRSALLNLSLGGDVHFILVT